MAVQQITDEQVIEAILTRRTVEDQAAYLGCNRSTIYRRRQDPAFMEKLEEIRRERFGHIVETVERSAQFAILELEAIATDPTAPAQARVSAANALLTHMGKFAEIELKREAQKE